MRTLLIAFGFLVACAGPAASAPKNAATVKTFGAAIDKSQAPAELSKVLAAPDEFAQKRVLVSGTVRAVCQNKGCWMELATAKDAAAPGCRVTFKDYGFFVPKTSGGKVARVDGTLVVKTISAEEVAHMESEGATVKNKAADGSAREVRLVANGVEISE